MKNIVGPLVVSFLLGCGGGRHEIKDLTDISLMEAIHFSNNIEDKMDMIIYQKMMELDEIDDDLAQEIVAQYRGNVLCLGNVTTISPEVASILARFGGTVLILPSLEIIDEETAENLSRYEGDIIVPKNIEYLLPSRYQHKKEIIREI